MKEVSVITECKSCSNTDLELKNCEVISDSDVNKTEIVEALYCKSCGTIHSLDGEWIQMSYKSDGFGYTKTGEVSSKIVENWN